jgi:pimeloyl-ACP methyl ester carboxylesterase
VTAAVLTPRVVATAAGDVEVAEVGAGPAVLVVHGTPGDWGQARGLAQDLAATHRVLLPSRPGYGRTPLSTGRTPAEQAAALVALLDALGEERAAVVGISGGGPASRALAAQHRDRCTALVLLCAVAEHLVSLPVATRLLAGVPGLWEVGSRIADRRSRSGLLDPSGTLTRVVAELSPAERAAAAADPRADADLLDFAHSRARALRSVAGLRNDFRCFQAATAPAEWPDGPALPVLVLHGDADEVVPLAHGEHHRDSVPGAVLEVLEGVGHAFPLSMRRATSARVLRHLAAS